MKRDDEDETRCLTRTFSKIIYNFQKVVTSPVICILNRDVNL
ncbi:hypothetical protein TcasGA2_TC032718 [Tribolium castaneum]|uniref:Uncharacterized protein n=1 Tax=Tribolium castaneum TaxID=7070 RepID=A0A139WIJ0_TRICA|nr:hypothetical protein TcasGA2_TC032718 [Tribolium castaneum]